MLRPRIIPCLLIHKGGLVKTVGFDKPKYVGDPLNAVRIFNEKEVDELMVVDIDATRQQRDPDYALIAKLASECRMPLAYGGGVHTVEQFERLISLGVEKVAASAAAATKPAKRRSSTKAAQVNTLPRAKRSKQRWACHTPASSRPSGTAATTAPATRCQARTGPLTASCGRPHCAARSAGGVQAHTPNSPSGSSTIKARESHTMHRLSRRR